ncbi:MAG TPA: RsmB/NOP family class I SAM-dependent RNA methyltransferase [Limnobacter sp.]|uniref:RsmB/NOP family class I SAM-dependent RNA methyltransferase n=1 Tax=Limnobacter sp. TaxID=2003368 RepID=UPI002ED99A4D
MTGSKQKNTPFRKPQANKSGGRGRAGEPRQGAVSRFGLVSQVAQLIDLLDQFEGPADATISRFFKDHPELGGRDRPLVAEAVYCWLRYRFRINHLAQAAEGPALMRQAKLALLWSGAPEPIWSAGRQSDNEWLSRVINVSADDLASEPRTCLPDWLTAKLLEQFGPNRVETFSQAVLQAAPLDVRVNTLKITVGELQQALAGMGVKSEPIEGLPDALRVDGKPALGKTELFQEGAFEVQDAGSQWVSRLVAPRRSDLVVDFCAGAGGKTLAIAALMKNTGRVVALDTSERRLQKFRPRAARAGMSNFYTLVINDEADPRLNKYYGKADRVLVDVPCTGMGTLRRNPDLKFRQDLQSLAELNQKQMSIIEHASKLVKPDGRLIYVTCSVLQDENERVVEAFLAAHPEFRLRRWTEVLNPNERPSKADTTADMLRLWPEDGESDGFFAAVLQRSKA